MINITIFVDSEHRYSGIELSGHAGDAVNHQGGQELVCAAVSALTINMANSVAHFTEDPFESHMEEAAGQFRFFFSGGVSAESLLLMNSLVMGLQDIEESYGEPYIKIRFKEV